MKHLPEEAYWRLTTPLNEDVNGGKGFSSKESMEIIKEERKLLEESEQETYDTYNR